jgi:hypothetical protein
MRSSATRGATVGRIFGAQAPIVHAQTMAMLDGPSSFLIQQLGSKDHSTTTVELRGAGASAPV